MQLEGVQLKRVRKEGLSQRSAGNREGGGTARTWRLAGGVLGVTGCFNMAMVGPAKGTRRISRKTTKIDARTVELRGACRNDQEGCPETR